MLSLILGGQFDLSVLIISTRKYTAYPLLNVHPLHLVMMNLPVEDPIIYTKRLAWNLLSYVTALYKHSSTGQHKPIYRHPISPKPMSPKPFVRACQRDFAASTSTLSPNCDHPYPRTRLARSSPVDRTDHTPPTTFVPQHSSRLPPHVYPSFQAARS